MFLLWVRDAPSPTMLFQDTGVSATEGAGAARSLWTVPVVKGTKPAVLCLLGDLGGQACEACFYTINMLEKPSHGFQMLFV